MTTSKHGLSIAIERINSQFFLKRKAIGKLTHENYKKITPLIDASLDGIKEPKVNVLIDGTELEGWELRAAWDDFKLGLKHNNEFEKNAIYGNRNWQKITAKIGSWFISGEIQYFEDCDKAINWLQQ